MIFGLSSTTLLFILPSNYFDLNTSDESDEDETLACHTDYKAVTSNT